MTAISRVVAIYARVSTEHEAQLSALENQIQYYDDELAKHPDWKLYDRYIDEGITGTSVKKRKNFMRMIEDAKKGCFDLIVTREVSRFARNTVDTLQETRKLKKMGVEVFFTDDNIWTFNDEDGELKLTLMATLAQNESKKTSQRVKAGQTISFKNGVFYGTGNILGYDYDKVNKKVLVNEEQAEIVKLIFSLFLEGYGSTKIKYELEKRGYRTSTGLKNWAASYIVRVLKNPFYCGTVVYRKSFVPDYLEQKAKRNEGEVEQVTVEGKHQPLISKEDFEKVQKILTKRSIDITEKTKKGHGIPKTIWSKKLICSCGSTFNKRSYHKKTDGSSTYCFQCYKQKSMGSAKTRLKKGLDISDACDAPIVQEWKMDIMTRIVFDTIWDDKEKIINMANQLIDETITAEDYNTDVENEIKIVSNKIDAHNRKLEKLLEMYISGNMISKEDYVRKKEEIEKEKLLLKNEIEELEQRRGIPKNTLEQKLQNLKQILVENLNWGKFIMSDIIIDTFVDQVTVERDHFKWKFKFLNDIINTSVEGRSDSSNPKLYINNEEVRPELNCGTSKNKPKIKKS